MPGKDRYEDDGRTIVDMSEIPHRNILFPTRIRHEERLGMPEETRNDRPWEKDTYNAKQTRWAMLGALRAGFLIFFVYFVVFGLFILGLYLLIANQMR